MPALRSRPRGVIRAGRFTPLSLPNCELWFAADRIATLLADAAAVATWQDVSGNGRNATQGTGANQPLFKTNVVNGRPAVRFDGVNDGLLTAAWTLPQQYSLFAVAQSSGGTYPENIFDADAVTAPRIMQFRFTNSTTAATIAFNTVPSAFTDSQASTVANYQVVSGVRDATTVQTWVNGTSDGSTATTGTPNSGSKAVTLGFNNSATPFQFLQGDIAEAIFYSRALSSAERRAVETMLAVKYGIGAAL